MTRPRALDRRNVLKLGAAAACVLATPPAAAFAARAACAGSSTVVLADSRYGESLIFAGSLERQGARLVALASDLAGTWSNAIAPRLSCGLHGLAGLTLASDLFILQRLAEGSGARTCYAGSHDWRCRDGAAHALSGSIDLDPIAAALTKGSEHWAERLGEVLLVARERSGETRRLQFECAMPSGRGPRFFVSWLMRWTA